MKQFLCIFSSIIIITHSIGCAGITKRTGNLNSRIDYLLSRQEYDKALKLAADAHEQSSPDIASLQEIEMKIRIRAEHYEQQVIADAENSAANSDWHTAFALYKQALSHLPNSQSLQQGQQQLLQRQQESLSRLKLDQLIAHGEWAYKDLLISKKAVAIAPDGWFANFRLKRKLANAQNLAGELAEQGQRALERKDLELANIILRLAMNLYATPEIEAANRRLQLLMEELLEKNAAEQKQITDEQEKTKKQLFDVRVQKKSNQLMTDFKKAYKENNLTKAQQLLKQLKKLNTKNMELQELSKQFDADVAEHVQYLIETGVTYYIQQQYGQALEVWKEAQIFDPKNEKLIAHIDRAARVLEKLQSLRGKQGVEE